MVKNKTLVLTIPHYKILYTVNYLNVKHYYPLSKGVWKILKGDIDEETMPFMECESFGTITSYSSKKISRLIMMLYRYHYLSKKYDEKTNEIYLEISPLGVSSLGKYLAKHKNSFKKKEKTIEHTIIQID